MTDTALDSTAPVRWSLSISPEVDASLREHLGAQGMKKGDLSRFVEEAVRWRLLDKTLHDIRSRLEGEDEAALQALIDDALDAVRHP
ncbi:MAG: ribbon-helix-helix domain-containing protein [Pseudomonadota bacterium]|nr:ribbon-helix-helix domain-containing protein [Pseudomonadota bacterium]